MTTAPTPTNTPPERFAIGTVCTWWGKLADAPVRSPQLAHLHAAAGTEPDRVCPYCGRGVTSISLEQHEQILTKFATAAAAVGVIGAEPWGSDRHRAFVDWCRYRCYENVKAAALAYRTGEAHDTVHPDDDTTEPERAELARELAEIGSAFADVPDEFLDQLREAMTAESLGAQLIATERRRVVSQLGYDSSHDDQHEHGELLAAARSYIAFARGATMMPPSEWPFEPEAFRPSSPTRALVKAGQFVCAEIDRLFRDNHLTGGGSPDHDTPTPRIKPASLDGAS